MQYAVNKSFVIITKGVNLWQNYTQDSITSSTSAVSLFTVEAGNIALSCARLAC